MRSADQVMTDVLTSTYDCWLARRTWVGAACAEKTMQAISAKAFRGELVPTEAELVRQEHRAYEPASVLLERIRAARALVETDNMKRKACRQPRGRRNG